MAFYIIHLPINLFSVFTSIHYLKVAVKPNNIETSLPWLSFCVFIWTTFIKKQFTELWYPQGYHNLFIFHRDLSFLSLVAFSFFIVSLYTCFFFSPSFLFQVRFSTCDIHYICVASFRFNFMKCPVPCWFFFIRI